MYDTARPKLLGENTTLENWFPTNGVIADRTVRLHNSARLNGHIPFYHHISLTCASAAMLADGSTTALGWIPAAKRALLSKSCEAGCEGQIGCATTKQGDGLLTASAALKITAEACVDGSSG